MSTLQWAIFGVGAILFVVQVIRTVGSLKRANREAAKDRKAAEEIERENRRKGI